MTNKETMEIMLQDFVDQFHKNLESKSIDSKQECCYYPPDRSKSPGCAIGMYLKDDIAKELDNLIESTIGKIIYSNNIKLLPKWMQKLPNSFLTRYQLLHDDYITKEGLEEDGKIEISRICKRFNLKEPILD